MVIMKKYYTPGYDRKEYIKRIYKGVKEDI